MVIFLCLKILNKKFSNTKYEDTVFLYTFVLFNISTFMQTFQLKRIFLFFHKRFIFFYGYFYEIKKEGCTLYIGQDIIG